ncbi:carboxymuconolactone decarboxylase family protein [Actinoplanes teichomyceticus]|nr:carboxymuconolactone decarboxylase family protein [Actinoplanes teichomyceticus]
MLGAERLLARLTRGVSQQQVRYVAAVPAAAATPRVRAVYAQVERDFGMLAPPVSLHAPSPDVLAAAWVLLRETLLAGDRSARAGKEAVAASVSAMNACPYCVQVHTATLTGLRRHPVEGRPADLSRTAVAVTFHYLNRMVNIFLGDPPLSAVPAGVRPAAARGAERLLGHLGARSHTPGASLDLLGVAEPPADLAWAGTGVVADALARACAAVEARAREAVPAPVAELVTARLVDWTGAPAGIDARRTCAAAAEQLPASCRASGRLLLLTAFASYQVTAADIAAFRRERDGDAALIEATAWAALAAARRWGRLLTAAR